MSVLIAMYGMRATEGDVDLLKATNAASKERHWMLQWHPRQREVSMGYKIITAAQLQPETLVQHDNFHLKLAKHVNLLRRLAV